MNVRLVDIPAGVMASTVVRYDESGRPMYANDLRLGNRRQRRHLLQLLRHEANRVERAVMADAGT